MELTISIIGFGNIGKAICILLLPKYEFNLTINIVDIDPNVKGAILDFQHGIQLYQNHQITYNSIELLNNSNFIFHCAGASVPKGQSRLFSSNESIKITEAIFKNFKPLKEPYVIVVSNPVEIISTITHKITGLPPKSIVGTGTFLDSIRMNYCVKKYMKNINTIDSILLGEHGNTVFLSKQLSSINGKKIDEILDNQKIDSLMNEVKQSAMEIKETQDATVYGVSYCAVKIFESLLSENYSSYPISTIIPQWLQKELKTGDLFLSLYSKINKSGVFPTDNYIPNDLELSNFKNSIKSLIPYIPKQYL